MAVELSADYLTKWVGQVLGSPARRAACRKWLDYYQGNQLKWIPRNRNETSEHFAGRPKMCLNITRRIVDTKSCLYDEGCLRESADADVTRFWRETDIDQRMREVDPVVRLCGTAFVFPDYVMPSRTFWGSLRSWFFGLVTGTPAEDGRYVWQTYLPNQVEVLLDPEYPEIPAALATIHTSTEAGVEHHTVQVWSASGYWRFEASGSPLAGGQAALSPELRAAEPHDFGRIPFCVLRNDPDWTADFWGRPEAPNMVPGNEEINRLVSSLQWLVICQSHGQWVAKNIGGEWVPKMGTDQIVVLPPAAQADEAQPDLTLVTPQPNVAGLKDTIDWQLDKLCETNDVPAGTYRLDMNRQSGTSLQEKRVATAQYRKRRRPQALAWERELAALARLVKAGRTGRPLPAGVPEIAVDYREPELPQPVADRVQREQHELATGQATVPEILMRHNPDYDWESAVAEYESNQAFNAEHRAAAAELDLDAAPGPVSPEARAQAEAAIAAAAAPAGVTGG